MDHRAVIVESPYAGRNPAHYRRNIAYLHACILDCLQRGEVPYASHGFYPGALDDTDPTQRTAGIEAGFRTAEIFHQVGGFRAFYTDRGESTGMGYARRHSEKIGMLSIDRQLGSEWSIDNDPEYCSHSDYFKIGDVVHYTTCQDCGADLSELILPADAVAAAVRFFTKQA